MLIFITRRAPYLLCSVLSFLVLNVVLDKARQRIQISIRCTVKTPSRFETRGVIDPHPYGTSSGIGQSGMLSPTCPDSHLSKESRCPANQRLLWPFAEVFSKLVAAHGSPPIAHKPRIQHLSSHQPPLQETFSISISLAEETRQGM